MSASPELIARVAPSLQAAGLNMFGVVGRDRWDAAVPPPLRLEALHAPARSILVVGSGGAAHFNAFLDWVAIDPVRRLGRQAHPLDGFTADVFARLASELDGCRVIYPTFASEVRIDFMKLAELAGLGRPSELGILVGATHGPWFALRAAVLTPELLAETGPTARLCDGCEAPCRVPATPLERRSACVVGPHERYSDEALVYHYDRAAGRRLLCERLGITDELGAG